MKPTIAALLFWPVTVSALVKRRASTLPQEHGTVTSIREGEPDPATGISCFYTIKMEDGTEVWLDCVYSPKNEYIREILTIPKLQNIGKSTTEVHNAVGGLLTCPQRLVSEQEPQADKS